MQRSGFIIGVFFLLMIGAVSVSAQAQPASKIVIVNTASFFDEKAGIIRIVNATKQLNNELAPKRAEVQQLVTRLETLERELATLRSNASKGIPVDEKAGQAKVDELERLKREGKYKEDEYNALAQKRQNEVVGPVYNEALKVLGEFIKSKGFSMVFDVSKDQSGMLIYVAEPFDITKEFITSFNSRPPTSITSVPK